MEKNAEEDIGHSDETVIFSVFTEGIRILCANQFLYTVASSLQKNSSDIFVSLTTYLFTYLLIQIVNENTTAVHPKKKGCNGILFRKLT